MDWIRQFIEELETEKAEAGDLMEHLGEDLFTGTRTLETSWVDTTQENKRHYQECVERLQAQIDRLKQRLGES